MNTAIIIVDDTITFSLFRGLSDGSMVYCLSLETFYTPYGLYVAPTRNGNEMLDLMEGKQIDAKVITNDLGGVLLTHTGHMYRFVRFGKTFSKQRIVYAKDSYSVHADTTELTLAFSMALHLKKLNVKKAIELVSKDLVIGPDHYQTFKISDICAELKKRGLTKDIVLIDPFGPEPAEKK